MLLVLAYQATRTALALRAVKKDTAVLAEQVRRGDAAGVRATLRHLTRQAQTAHDNSDNLLWSAAGRMPYLGGDVRAVRAAASALDSTSQRALPTALELYDALKQQRLRTDDGRFDLTTIAGLTPRFQELGADLAPAARDLDGIDTDTLKVPAVRTAAADLQQRLGSLVTLATAGTKATQVLPSMLGADGPRRYLLVVQNTAEIRATGGLPGSLLVITARDGKISLGARYSARDFLPGTIAPILPVSQQEKALYGLGPAQDIREVNEVPDWPRAAELVEAFNRRSQGGRLDGVLGTDPVALSALLKATGPVTVAGDTFTSSDVVRKLLNTVYLRFDDADAQDGYFAAAAKGIFDRLSSRPVDQLAVVRELGTIGAQRRFLVWSRDAAVEKVLAGTSVSGELPTGAAAATDVGMYLNDGTGAKMQYYLDYVGGVRAVSCDSDGSQVFESRLRMRSDAPADAASLPYYIVGNGSRAPKGTQRVFLRIYGPSGGTITRLVANGKEQQDFHVFTHRGRPVVYLNLLVRPQGSIDIVATSKTASGASGRPEVEWTPGIRSGATSVSTASACG